MLLYLRYYYNTVYASINLYNPPQKTIKKNSNIMSDEQSNIFLIEV
jgi:hypothetical protein